MHSCHGDGHCDCRADDTRVSMSSGTMKGMSVPPSVHDSRALARITPSGWRTKSASVPAADTVSTTSHPESSLPIHKRLGERYFRCLDFQTYLGIKKGDAKEERGADRNSPPTKPMRASRSDRYRLAPIRILRSESSSPSAFLSVPINTSLSHHYAGRESRKRDWNRSDCCPDLIN